MSRGISGSILSLPALRGSVGVLTGRVLTILARFLGTPSESDFMGHAELRNVLMTIVVVAITSQEDFGS